MLTGERENPATYQAQTPGSAEPFVPVASGTFLALASTFPSPTPKVWNPLFKVRLNPEVIAAWNALPPRTRGNLEKQLNGMARVVGFRDLLSDSERYGSVRTGKVEVLYELDTSSKLLCAYEVRRHEG